MEWQQLSACQWALPTEFIEQTTDNLCHPTADSDIHLIENQRWHGS
jgi:hypothetical protein